MFISLRKRLRLFSKNTIEVQQDIPVSSDLRFDYSIPKINPYDRGKLRLKIFMKEELFVETNGYNYIRYPSLMKEFLLDEKSITFENFSFVSDSEVIYFDQIHRQNMESKNLDVVATYQNENFNLYSSNRWSGRINEIRYRNADLYCIALGILAYRWLLYEQSDLITA